MTKKRKKSLKQKRQEERARAARLQRLRFIGLAIIILGGLGGLIAWRNAGRVPVEEIAAVTPPNLDGPADAPVRIVEFGDFGCPSCRAWHNAGIKEQLQADFGDQISFEFRHFPVITRQSPKAAEAGQCAAEQGAFWEYHDYIYEQAPQGRLGISDLKSYAAAIGLDQAAFVSCLDSGKYESYVLRDQQAAINAGARGTPTFFINGQQVSFSYQGLSTAIQQALNQ